MNWLDFIAAVGIASFVLKWTIKDAMRKVNKETLPGIDGIIRGAVSSGVLDALHSFEEGLRKFEDQRRREQ